jgi:hypothetical protein
MSAEQISEKKKLLEEQQKTKAAQPVASPPASGETPKPARPVFKPKIKPPGA